MSNTKSILIDKLTKVPQSYWMASTPQTNFPALTEDVKVDVAIVGGGMVGITCGLLLKKEGLKVAIIEANRILQGTTGHTTAKITSQHDLIYYKIKNNMGKEMARQYAEANESAIRFIESIITEMNIDCDFEHRSAYIYTVLDEYVQKIEDEAKTASELGIKAVYLDKTPLPFDVKAAVRFDNQAQFHPRKYLLALSNEIPGDGSHIFEKTMAIDINEREPCEVLTNRGKKVIAQTIVLASHYPFYDKPGLYFTRLYPERSYALGVKIKEAFPEGMYITAEDPGRSLRSQRFEDEELVIVSGEHHKTGQGEDMINHYGKLLEFAEDTFTLEDILYRWSTQDYTSLDDVPYVGHLTSKTPNIYVATGFRKWGMTNSTASAIIIKDLITKGRNPWQEVYSPSRFTPTASITTFVRENADVAEKFIAGKLMRVPDDVEITKGEGKIMEVNGEKAGAYRDEKGILHLVDTTCPHLGCELQWNSAEKSWDCPCHGSRFTYEGDIINGPALKSIKIHTDNTLK